MLSFALLLATLPLRSNSQVTKVARAKPERRLKSLMRNGANSAYTRYDELPGLRAVATYTKVLPGPDYGQPGFNPATEFYSATFLDGYERAQAQMSDHPGSTGGYRTVYNAYDQMGRL